VWVDVVSERTEFESEGHTLQYHLLVEVGCAEGALAEAVYEDLQRLVLFLSNVEERRLWFDVDGCRRNK